jgi:plastocyanin
MLKKLIGVIVMIGLGVVMITGCSSESNPADYGGGPTLEFSSSTLTNGQTFQHTFATAKSMNYYCSFHGTATSGMFATITVTAGGSPNLIQSNITDNALQTLNIDVGDTVRWTNQGNNSHNVRSAN